MTTCPGPDILDLTTVCESRECMAGNVPPAANDAQCCALERLLVRCCAPTLAGLKTANLFSFPMCSKDRFMEQLDACNRKIRGKKLCLLPLAIGERSALIYVCRPGRLKRELESSNAAKFLASRGYEKTDVGYCLCKLKKRLGKKEGFPHEMGLFLGYPLEDVKGFIENAGKNCKKCGHWKVYGDEQAAMKTFEKYKKCKRIYSRLYARGVSITKLTVAA